MLCILLLGDILTASTLWEQIKFCRKMNTINYWAMIILYFWSTLLNSVKKLWFSVEINGDRDTHLNEQESISGTAEPIILSQIEATLQVVVKAEQKRKYISCSACLGGQIGLNSANSNTNFVIPAWLYPDCRSVLVNGMVCRQGNIGLLNSLL